MSAARCVRLSFAGVEGLKALQRLHTVLAHQRTDVLRLELTASTTSRIDVELMTTGSDTLAVDQLVKRLRREPNVVQIEVTDPTERHSS